MARLTELVAQTHEVIDEQTSSRGARVEAAQSIEQTKRRARTTLLRLDAFMRHLLRDDPPLLAVWKRSRKIERPPQPKAGDESSGQLVPAADQLVAS
ncbi:MAG: hypothetical protein HY646_18060, partial [Acidobacteria bacterium]|nr:hypothetical protein [Acidobacteriota bacterium]